MIRRRERHPQESTMARPAGDRKPPALGSYLQKILTARVYDVAHETPLEPARSLSKRLSNQVLLKREDSQPVFSFKMRGAYNKMAHLSTQQLERGVICASAGNHAQGVALAARKLGCKALVVMPVTTPRLKVDAVRSLGGDVVLHGDSYSDAYAHALELERAQGLTFVHPFDDPDVIAGQGTIAMEILRQRQGPIDAVFVAVGGGGLISGVAAYIKAVRPEIRVVGVQIDDSDAMIRSIEAGERVAEVGEEREALFAVTIPEERGSFRRFCAVIGPRAVTEFNYRISEAKVAHILVGIATIDRAESALLAAEFEKNGFSAVDLTADELAKEHVRHMVGGRSPLAKDE